MATASKTVPATPGSGGDENAAKAKLFDKVKKEIRSILQTAAKTGLTPEALSRDYMDLTQKQIPLKELGYLNLYELLDAMPDAVDAYELSDGNILLFAKSSAATAHLEKLIVKAKPSKLGRFGGIVPQPAICRRGTQERRKLIEKRLIEVASDFPDYISYYDIFSAYQAKFYEALDPKGDFGCQAKALFTIKLSHAFDVKSREGSGSFFVRLKQQLRPKKSPTRTQRPIMGGGHSSTGPSMVAHPLMSPSLVTASSVGQSSTVQPPEAPVRHPVAPSFSGFRIPYAACPENMPRPPQPGPMSVPFPLMFQPTGMHQPIIGPPAHIMFMPPRSLQLPPNFAQRMAIDQANIVATNGLVSGHHPDFYGVPIMNQLLSNQQPQTSATMDLENQPPQMAAMLDSDIQRTQQPSNIDSGSIMKPSTPIRNMNAKPSTPKNVSRDIKAPDVPSLPPPEEIFDGSNLASPSASVPQSPPVDLVDPMSASNALGFASGRESRISADDKKLLRRRLDLDPNGVKQWLESTKSMESKRSLSDLKEDCAMVLSSHSSGVPYLQFSKAYRDVIGRELEKDMEPHNMLSVNELIDTWPDIFVVHVIDNKGCLLFDKKSYADFVKLKNQATHSKNQVVLPKNQTTPPAPKTIDQWAQGTVEDELITALWRIVMTLPGHTIFLKDVQRVYLENTGKAFPISDDAMGEFGMRMFDYPDRFLFCFEDHGGLRITAVPGYDDPRTELASNNGDLQKSLSFVQYGESYQLQPLPLSSQQLIGLDNSDPSRFFQVLIAQVYSPGQFFVQLNASSEQLAKMQNELNDYFTNSNSSTKAVIKLTDVKPGLACAFLSDDDNVWYRGQIKEIYNQQNITVFMVDYGTEVNVASDMIRYLPRRFFTFPTQAIEARLKAIKPIGEDWSLEAGEVMADICGESILWAELFEVSEDGIPHIDLTLMDAMNNEIHITDSLINRNLAVIDMSEFRGDDFVGGIDQLSLEDEIESPVEEKAIELNGPAAALSGEEEEKPEDMLDLTREEEIMTHILQGLREGNVDVQIFYFVRSYFCRLRVDLNNFLTASTDETTTEKAVDKLNWLEKRIEWLNNFCA